jgi:putative ABC transport system ATP-binding protein
MDVVNVDAPAVEARELYRFYHAGDDEVLALRGVSLTVRSGEFVAIMGPSGSGKSTLLACLAGLDEPDGGAVFVAGARVSRRSERERAALRARGVGVVLQGANLVEHLTVSANLRLASRLADRRARPDVAGLLGRVGLVERASAHPAQLSGGEAVRAAVAVALVNQPAVVVADEPTAEIDRANERALLDLLRSEVDRGVALVVATHSSVVADLADRVVSLADGRVVA